MIYSGKWLQFSKYVSNVKLIYNDRQKLKAFGVCVTCTNMDSHKTFQVNTHVHVVACKAIKGSAVCPVLEDGKIICFTHYTPSSYSPSSLLSMTPLPPSCKNTLLSLLNSRSVLIPLPPLPCSYPSHSTPPNLTHQHPTHPPTPTPTHRELDGPHSIKLPEV